MRFEFFNEEGTLRYILAPLGEGLYLEAHTTGDTLEWRGMVGSSLKIANGQIVWPDDLFFFQRLTTKVKAHINRFYKLKAFW